MGQRLNIEIWNDGEVIANAYYHWSAFTTVSAKLVNKALNFINENPIDNENILLYAIRVLEATGAGLYNNEIEYAKEKGLNMAERLACNGRNDGLLSISEEGIQETRMWQDGAVYIYLDEKRISFRVFLTRSCYEWEQARKAYDEENANSENLDVVNINFDDIKFSKWDSVFEMLANREELSFRSNIDLWEVMTMME